MCPTGTFEEADKKLMNLLDTRLARETSRGRQVDVRCANS